MKWLLVFRSPEPYRLMGNLILFYVPGQLEGFEAGEWCHVSYIFKRLYWMLEESILEGSKRGGRETSIRRQAGDEGDLDKCGGSEMRRS